MTNRQNNGADSERNTKVLIAIPTLFTRDALRQEIESLEHQSKLPYKILLITPKGYIGKDWEEFLVRFKGIELAYLENYTREEVLNKTKDSRIDARNYALTKAREELGDDDIVVFLDDDCTLDANWIEVALNDIRDKENGGFSGKIIHYRDHGSRRRFEELGLNLMKFLFGSNKVGSITDCGFVSSNFDTPSKCEVMHLPGIVAYKLRAVRNLRFDENFIGNCYREETDFAVKVNKNWKLVYDPATTAHHFMGVTRRDKYSMYYKSYNHIYFWKSNFKFTFCFFLRELTETLLLLGASLLSFKTDYLYGIKGKIDGCRKFLFAGE